MPDRRPDIVPRFSETIIDKASLFGTNVGHPNYAGPLLLNFGAGDSIDLKDVASAGVSLNYTSSTGLLQVSSGRQWHHCCSRGQVLGEVRSTPLMMARATP